MTPLADPILRTTFCSLVGATPHATELIARDGVGYVASHFLCHNLNRLGGLHTLVLHGSDQMVDDELLKHVPKSVRVFAMNCGTSRAHPLPIGLRIDAHDSPLLADLRRAASEPKGDKLAYLCATWNNANLPECARVERLNLYNRFKGQEWATVRGGQTMGDVPFADFCADLRQHRYVLCPRGAGMDSHRIFEGLYLGCIPITRHGAVMDRLKHWYPMLQIHDWSQVTPKLLEANYERLRAEVDALPLTADYWVKKIL